jgi:hypothetical protein
LKQACTTPEDFLALISSVFSDLEKGVKLNNFRAIEFDALSKSRSPDSVSLIKRVGRSLLLQPNFSGVGIDLKQLFAPTPRKQ